MISNFVVLIEQCSWVLLISLVLTFRPCILSFSNFNNVWSKILHHLLYLNKEAHLSIPRLKGVSVLGREWRWRVWVIPIFFAASHSGQSLSVYFAITFMGSSRGFRKVCYNEGIVILRAVILSLHWIKIRIIDFAHWVICKQQINFIYMDIQQEYVIILRAEYYLYIKPLFENVISASTLKCNYPNA